MLLPRRVVRFDRVNLGDSPLCAGCTVVLLDPVDIFVKAAEAVSGFA